VDGSAHEPAVPFCRASRAKAPDFRGQEAVRQMMLTAPEAVWTQARITRGILSRGWIDPDAKVPAAAIRAATQRLAAAGMAKKVGSGRYELTERGREAGRVGR